MALILASKNVVISSRGTLKTIADIAVTATPTQIASNTAIEVLLSNNGGSIIRLGDSAITATRGFPLAVGASIVWTINESNLLYHRTESGTSTLSVTVLS